MHHTRAAHPVRYGILIALVFNVHYLCLAAALALGLLFFLDVRAKISPLRLGLSLVIMTAGFALAIAAHWPKGNEGEAQRFLPFDFGDVFLPTFNAYSLHQLWIPPAELTFGVGSAVLLIVLLAVPLLSFLDTRGVTFFLVTAFVGVFAIFITKLQGEFRHHFFLVVFWVMALWMSRPTSPRGHVSRSIPRSLRSLGMLVLMCALLLSTFHASSLIRQELRHPFSSARYMATYIRDRGLHNSHRIAAFPSWAGSALLPYLPDTEFWYPDMMAHGTYVVWTRERERRERAFKRNPERLVQTIRRNLGDDPNTLVLLNWHVDDARRQGLTLIQDYSDRDAVKLSERYYLYALTVP